MRWNRAANRAVPEAEVNREPEQVERPVGGDPGVPCSLRAAEGRQGTLPFRIGRVPLRHRPMA